MRQSGHMTRTDLERLAKILAMTQSDHDAEAVAAARMAKRMMQRAGLSYEDLLNGFDPGPGTSGAQLQQKIDRLENELAVERKRSGALAAALRQAKETAARDGQDKPYIRSLEQLRIYLMGHFALKHHERALLERIEDPRPKTKEAHIVLICAQRYGVAFG